MSGLRRNRSVGHVYIKCLGDWTCVCRVPSSGRWLSTKLGTSRWLFPAKRINYVGVPKSRLPYSSSGSRVIKDVELTVSQPDHYL
eukprot:6651540-Pyramimonas_sp.AAC.1